MRAGERGGVHGEIATGRLLVLWAFGEMTIYGSLWSDLPNRGRWREGGRVGAGREAGGRLLTQRPAAEEPR